MEVKILGTFKPSGERYVQSSSVKNHTKSKQSYCFDDDCKFPSGTKRKRDPRHVLVPGHKSTPTCPIEEELYITESKVVWSVDGELHQTFSFEAESQPVTHAFFAYFDIATDASNYVPSYEFTNDNYDSETFGPFYIARQRLNQERQAKHMQLSRRRALCILLHDIAKIYVIGGSTFAINLPFPVERAWALDVGIMLQRKPEEDELNPSLKPTRRFSNVVGSPEQILGNMMDLELNNEQLPLLFSLSSPLDEITVVSSSNILDVRRDDQGYKHIIVGKETQQMTDLAEDVLFISPLNPLVAVTLNSSTDLCSIWRYESLAEHDKQPQMSNRRRRSSGSRRRSSLPKDDSTRMALGDSDANIGLISFHDGEMKSRVYLQLVKQFPVESSRENISVCVAKQSDTTSILCILDKIAKTVIGYRLEHSLEDAWTVDEIFREPALSVAPIKSTDTDKEDILILGIHFHLHLWTAPSQFLNCEMPRNFQSNLLEDLSAKRRRDSIAEMQAADMASTNILRSPSRASRVIDLMDPINERINVVLSDGLVVRVALDFMPKENLTHTCIKALRSVMPEVSYFDFRNTYFHFRHAPASKIPPGAHCKTDWEAFVIALFAGFIGKGPKTVPRQLFEQKADAKFDGDNMDDWTYLLCSEVHQQDNIAFTGLSTPNVSGDCMLRLWRKACVLCALPALSIPSCFLGGYAPWILYALHLVAENIRLDVRCEAEQTTLLTLLVQLARWCGWSSFFEYYVVICPLTATKQYMSRPADIVQAECPAVPSIFDYCYGVLQHSEVGDFPLLDDIPEIFNLGIDITAVELNLTSRICAIYRILRSESKDFGKAAESILLYLVSTKMGRRDIDNLPIGISLPIFEALAFCRSNPKGDWSIEAYKLIDREDIARQMSPSSNRISAKYNEIDEADGDIVQVTALRYQHDLRFVQVAELLHSASPKAIKVTQDGEVGEQELTAHQQSVMKALAMRTAALPLGRAAIVFGTMHPVSTTRFDPAGVDIRAKLLPFSTIKELESGVVPNDFLDWPNFHDGVCAGLSIVADSEVVDNSWIAFNRPDDLSNGHAGFLMALGLTGRLKSLITWQAFTYLTPKHDITSIGLLLGLAASHLGSSDAMITKVLSVHNPALLPPNSSELNLSPLMQTASLYGVGLLYVGTQNRRITEILLGEIGRVDNQYGSDATIAKCAESYSLAAGIALGMVVLGKGDEAEGLLDLDLADILYRYMKNGQVQIQKKRIINAIPDLAAPGATIALGLIFLKTNNANVAAKLEIPITDHELAHVRPDFLLLRNLSRNLIMWDSIGKSQGWINTQIPSFILEKVNAREHDDAAAISLAYTNLVAGACLAMALKYAGSMNEDVCMTLLSCLDSFMKASNVNASTFEEKIARTAVRTGLDLLALSVATVMAGSGDLRVLRRLLKLHSRISHDVTYGSHMATHMALGILFLGAGRCTFGTSNLAIAALVAAYYPRFPNNTSDNRAHLQALRHLWVLAVEARCLVVRDYDTKEPCSVPLTVELLNEESCLNGNGQNVRRVITQRMEAPWMMPNFEQIVSIAVDSPRYWPLKLDVARNPIHARNLLNTKGIIVKRKLGHLPYTHDPRGFSSIFSRPFPGDPAIALLGHTLTLRHEDETDVAESFAADPQFSIFADIFYSSLVDTRPKWASFAISTLYDGFTAERSEMLVHMMDICSGLWNRDLRALYILSRNLKGIYAFYDSKGKRIKNLVPRFAYHFLLVVKKQLEMIVSEVEREYESLLRTYIQRRCLPWLPEVDLKTVVSNGFIPQNLDATFSKDVQALAFLLTEYEIPESRVLDMIASHGMERAEQALIDIGLKTCTIDVLKRYI